MNPIFVFYAGQLLGEYDENETAYRNIRRNPEIYNGAIQYCHDDREARHWYRMDWTPLLLEDVPKELRLIVLLLT